MIPPPAMTILEEATMVVCVQCDYDDGGVVRAAEVMDLDRRHKAIWREECKD